MVYVHSPTAEIRRGKKEERRRKTTVIICKPECGLVPNVMAALPNIGGAFCSTPQSLADAHYYRVPCSKTNAAKIGERKTWTQSECCTWQHSVTEQEPPKMYIYNVSAQEMSKHRAKFGWLPFSDVAAVTKPRRETR